MRRLAPAPLSTPPCAVTGVRSLGPATPVEPACDIAEPAEYSHLSTSVPDYLVPDAASSTAANATNVAVDSRA